MSYKYSNFEQFNTQVVSVQEMKRGSSINLLKSNKSTRSK